MKNILYLVIVLLMIAIVQNATISSQIEHQKAQIEQLEKQAQYNEKAIKKLLTPQQINQLRAEIIMENSID